MYRKSRGPLTYDDDGFVCMYNILSAIVDYARPNTIRVVESSKTKRTPNLLEPERE